MYLHTYVHIRYYSNTFRACNFEGDCHMPELSSAEQKEILDILHSILQEHPHRYYNSYYLWHKVNRDHSHLANRLKEVYGEGVGTGAGEHFSPASYISQVLSRSDKIAEPLWLHTVGMSVHGISASYDETRIYKWRETGQ